MRKTKTIRIQEALQELQNIIKKKYPSATFSILRGGDTPGYYLEAFVDIDDTDEVTDLVIDRVVNLQVYEKLPIYVHAHATPERNEKIFREQQRSSHYGYRLADSGK